MIQLFLGKAVLLATFVGCYDGDTCTLEFIGTPRILMQQKLRFADFDTPEIRGQCRWEKKLAREAREVTKAYVQGGGELKLTGKRGKFGRLLVRADPLRDDLVDKGLAVKWAGRRHNWCAEQ